jgi:hypothetical protein
MSKESEVQLVPVRTYSGNTARIDAEMAKGVLTEAGIECVIPGEVAADTFPFLDVPLLVREDDLARATEVLENAFAPDQSEEGGEPAEE